jgi:hypothetical protein
MTTENKLKTVVILKENQRQDVIGSENLSDRPTESEGRREPAQRCVFPVYPVESGPADVTCIRTVMDGLAGVAHMRASGNSSCCWYSYVGK